MRKKLLKNRVLKAIEKYGIPKVVIFEEPSTNEIPKDTEKALEFHIELAKKQMKINNERISAIQRVNQDIGSAKPVYKL